jgi:hypothetical protein
VVTKTPQSSTPFAIASSEEFEFEVSRSRATSMPCRIIGHFDDKDV